MKKLFLFIMLLSISQLFYAQNYKQVKIYFENKNELSEIYKLGLDIDEGYIGKDNSISVFISGEKFPLLVNSKFDFEILIDDWLEHFNSKSKLEESLLQSFKVRSNDLYGITLFNYGSMGGNYTMQEVYNELDNMRAQFPNLISAKFSIGTTFEGRNMYVAKISDNPNINENEPKVFFNSLTHCREPQGMMTIMYYMFYLLENYGTDPEVTFLVDNREIYFLPVVNPDGYEYNRTTNPNGGGMWRKNRRGSGANIWGIDLNRNFGYKWGYDDYGSSPYQSDETYRGASAFSEPETQAVRDFCIQKNFKVAMNYHTYSNLCLSPWGYITQETSDSLLFREFQKEITDYNGYTWGTPGSVLYNVNGGADDWMYGEQTLKQKTISMTIEIGNDSDGFWPDQDRIFPLAEENLKPNLYLTWIAGEFVKFVEAHFDQEYLDPGENINMTSVIKNMGLGDASNVSIALSSPDPKITINTGVENIGTVVSQHADSNDTPFNFSISSTAVPGNKLPLIITIKTGTTVMATDTFNISIGTPTILFADETDDPSINWTLTSTPSNYKWEATSTSYYSPLTSFTESKLGNYPNNATITMILKNPIDLSDADSPFLSYWTKWDIETDWDYSQVSITTNNGTTWIPLAGKHMNTGAGSFQPGGQPLYDGTQPTWIKEEIDLTPYAGSQIKLRFQLKTDGVQVRDGWYIDDIKLHYYDSNIHTQNVSVLSGWNMISIPLLASDMKVTSLFPSATSNAYEYTGIYNAVTEFSMGHGYWLKFDSEQSFPISGTQITTNINLQPGWNIIGPFLNEINVVDITTIPENIIISDFFGYNGIYVIATELSPGKSYWVKSSQAGELIFNSSTNKSD